MKKLNDIKMELKKIQSNFNPQKSTYKLLDNLINNNFSISEMINNLSRIKGISKYPDDLRQKILKIISDLKEIEDHELEEKLRKRKELQLQEQEERTRELKDLIDALETRKDSKNVIITNEEKEDTDMAKVLDKLNEDNEKYNDLVLDKDKFIFKILLFFVSLTFVILVCIFFLY